jgi:hypothetical protein
MDNQPSALSEKHAVVSPHRCLQVRPKLAKFSGAKCFSTSSVLSTKLIDLKPPKKDSDVERRL